ncbi:hypothetical protein [Pelomicrobium methylotrophicum]|uniref:Uncharacterized protein n=1 Tax=Pelomicrobium methylotrophicum TaxID=2602750 RepID=A0A5C7EKM1_9PROT|nr:hypothetical protein [Pelomicrobium methylotrophicum]TXF11928.1 hypothetical protein FR698_07960 [Pelomicrobium methylotrophicum]
MLYRYTGPLTALTLPGGQEVILTPGATVELPEDNPAIATLVALGRLKPEPAAAPKKSAPKGD